jgi:NAD(P)-dependent dehydrogenase (short-subunit alcohol dehydrogenase family)
LLGEKVAVVTGAGRGIGRAIAIHLATLGARVVVNDLPGEEGAASPADAVAEEIRAAGGDAVAVEESVSTMTGGKRLIEAANDYYGRFDALVCNAGILRPASLFDLTEVQWDDVIEANLKGHFTVMQPAARHMRAQRSGSIVVLTSSGGLEGSPNQPNYAASKEGILGLMRSAALALAPHVTCNAVSPSALTRMLEQMRPGHDPGRPEDIAPVVAFLLSDAARHLTGQVVGAAGDRVSLFPQPCPARSIFREGGWTAEQLAQVWDGTLGSERLLRYDRFVKIDAEGQ